MLPSPTPELHCPAPPAAGPVDDRLASLLPEDRARVLDFAARLLDFAADALAQSRPTSTSAAVVTATSAPAPAPPEPVTLLTVPGVAARLSVSPRTVERHIAAGHLRPLWIGGQRRFHVDTVDAFIRASAATGKARSRRSSARRSTPRATGTNPRAKGTNPRATATNPRAQRDAAPMAEGVR